MEHLGNLAIIISLSLTVPYLCYCIDIAKFWKPSLDDDKEPSKRLARGIFYGFTASGFDNLYWGVTWLLVLFNNDVGLFMVAMGSLANIFFRQIGGIYAAREHVIAAQMMHRRGGVKMPKVYWYMSLASFFSLTYLVYIN